MLYEFNPKKTIDVDYSKPPRGPSLIEYGREKKLILTLFKLNSLYLSLIQQDNDMVQGIGNICDKACKRLNSKSIKEVLYQNILINSSMKT